MTDQLLRRSRSPRPSPATARTLPDRRPRDGRDGPPSIALVVAAPLPVLIGALALHSLLSGISWWVSAIVTVAVLVGVLLVVRRRSRGARFITLVVTLLVLSCAVALLNDSQPLGWLDQHGALGSALESIRVNPAPLPLTDPLRLMATVMITWVAGLSLFLAVVAPAAALSSFPALVLLIVPTTITGELTDTVLVVLCAVAFLLVLWLSVRPVQHAFPAAVIAAIAVVVAVGLPALVPINAGFLSGVTGAIQAPIDPGRPGTLLRLGDDLRQPTEIEVLRYRTLDGDPEYLRLATLDDFGTGDWVPTATDASNAPKATTTQFADGVNYRLATQADTEIRITGLSSSYLPVPSGTSSITSRSTALDLGDWRWTGVGNTVRSTGPVTRRGDLYEADGAATWAGPYLDAVAASGRLNRLSGSLTAPPAAELRADTVVPKDLPSIIRTEARIVAGDAGNAYAKGRALEAFFRSDRFTYSETAPVEQGYDGDSMDVIAQFLRVRAGYCVHFSSAMAIMARTLGIPSRIAVGYRPGPAGADGEYAVSNRQLHAWPELYIQGAGWVAFEPTPLQQDGAGVDPGATPTAAPATPSTAPSESVPTPTAATPTPSASPTAGAIPPNSTSDGGLSAGSVAGIVLGVLALLVLVLGPGGLRLLRRRRRIDLIASGRDPALNAWREVLDDIADHGFAPNAAPPGDAGAAARTARAVLARLVPRLPADAVVPLTRIVDALDVERYAGGAGAGAGGAGAPRSGDGAGAGAVSDGLPESLLTDVARVRQVLDAALTPVARIRSRLVPGSFLPTAAWTGGRRPGAAR